MKNKWTALFISFILYLIVFGHFAPVRANTANSKASFVIHEVHSGETLYSISGRYGQSIQTIRQINGLTTDRIVPGQSLLIPGHTYPVMKGDSLWKIADRHGISVDELIKANRIGDPNRLQPETKLTIPQPSKQWIVTGGYVVPTTPSSTHSLLHRYKPIVTQIGIFEFHPDWNGNLSHLDSKTIVQKSWIEQMEPVAVITNLSKKGFDPNLTHHLLNTPAARNNLIRSIERLVTSQPFKGVNIDFEQIKPVDRDALNQFIKELSGRLKPSGFTISIAVPAKQGDRSPEYLAAYDYATLGAAVDHVFLMTYDWHWPGGPPGPIAPIDQVRATLDYAVKTIPKQKLFLGIAMYAYDWTYLPDGKTRGTAYSQNRAIQIATQHWAPVQYDGRSASCHFVYTDSSGHKHEVWFEDARSIIKKYRLVYEYGIRGMGGWKLGLSFPQAEEMLPRMFSIVKP